MHPDLALHKSTYTRLDQNACKSRLAGVKGTHRYQRVQTAPALRRVLLDKCLGSLPRNYPKDFVICLVLQASSVS